MFLPPLLKKTSVRHYPDAHYDYGKKGCPSCIKATAAS